MSAPENEFLDYVLELLQDMGGVYAKRMFGGYGIFRDNLMFGLIADEEFYLKVDDSIRGEYEDRGLAPFTYYKKGKPMQLSYYHVAEEAMEQSEEMIAWAEKSFAVAVQAAAKKSKRGKKKQ